MPTDEGPQRGALGTSSLSVFHHGRTVEDAMAPTPSGLLSYKGCDKPENTTRPRCVHEKTPSTTLQSHQLWSLHVLPIYMLRNTLPDTYHLGCAILFRILYTRFPHSSIIVELSPSISRFLAAYACLSESPVLPEQVRWFVRLITAWSEIDFLPGKIVPSRRGVGKRVLESRVERSGNNSCKLWTT